MTKALGLETQPLVEVRGIRKRYGAVQALDGVSLSFRAGEVHAVLGENGAGKSTLMRILAGEEQPDAGEIWMAGERLRLRSPLDARERGIGMVHQHFALVETLSVRENFAVALAERGQWRFDRRQVEARLRACAEPLGLPLPPLDETVARFPVGTRQRLEILRALAGAQRVLILDEPTAVLTPHEAEQLFALLRRLKAQGLLVLFITHRLPEVAAVADRVTVLRQGRVVGTFAGPFSDLEALARHMVGERSEAAEKPQRRAGQETLLELRDVQTSASTAEMALEGVSLAVRSGEIVGVAGVDGNGQRELFEVLAGLRPIQSGEVLVHGRPLHPRAPAQMLTAGFGFVPPDRQREGLILSMSVAENLLLHPELLGRFSRHGFLQWRPARAFAGALVGRFGIRTSSLDAPAAALSGGNQQRLILARELAAEPRLLVAVNPTRGLDFVATRAIARALEEVAARGCGVLLISTDLDEVMASADRITVLYRGRTTPFVEPPWPLDRLAAWMAGIGLQTES